MQRRGTAPAARNSAASKDLPSQKVTEEEVLAPIIREIKRNLACNKHTEDVCFVHPDGRHQQYTASQYADHARMKVSIPFNLSGIVKLTLLAVGWDTWGDNDSDPGTIQNG